MVRELKNYIISLKNRPDRLKEFMEANKDVRIDIEMFDAIDGNIISKNALIQNEIISAQNNYSPAALGCLVSHLTLWKQAVDQNAQITIFEDDAVLHKDFQDLSRSLIEEHADFDIIFWGCNTDWPIELAVGAGFPSVTLLCGPGEPRFSPMTPLMAHPKLLKVTLLAGLCSYTISPKGAEKLLRLLLPLGNEDTKIRIFKDGLGNKSEIIPWINTGIDVALSKHLVNINSYISFPFIAGSKNDWNKSSIQKFK